MIALMPAAILRSGPAPAAATVLARQAKAPMVLSWALIASSDWSIAVSAERSPESIRRWSSASEIIGIVPLQGSDSFYGPVGIGQAQRYPRLSCPALCRTPRLSSISARKNVEGRDQARPYRWETVQPPRSDPFP